MEDKEGFVRAPSAALVEHGDGRYDWLRDGTLTYYIGRGGEEEDEGRPTGVTDAETRELADELSRRQGVDVLRSGPDGWLETSVEGPVTVLVVRD